MSQVNTTLRAVWAAIAGHTGTLADHTGTLADHAATMAGLSPQGHTHAGSGTNAIPLGASVDLDTYQTPGEYYQVSDANAGAGSNYPPGPRAGSLSVKKGAGVSQIYYEYKNGGQIWWRGFYGGSWSAWVRLSSLSQGYEGQTGGTLSLNASYEFSHGLGSTPRLATFAFVCVSSESGWSVGDELPFALGTENYNSNSAPSVRVNSSKLTVRTGSNRIARTIGLDGSGRQDLTPSKWKLKVRAWHD